jgi:hypothetical protein
MLKLTTGTIVSILCTIFLAIPISDSHASSTPATRLVVLVVNNMSILTPRQGVYLKKIERMHPTWALRPRRVVTVRVSPGRVQSYVGRVPKTIHLGERIRIRTQWEYVVKSYRNNSTSSVIVVDRLDRV